TKKPALCHLSKGGFCSRARLKISKGQVVFFEKITQKISTFKPLPIFILSVLSSLPKARLSKNKIFIVFRFSSVTDKTTQNKKDTREVSRIFYSAIAPVCCNQKILSAKNIASLPTPQMRAEPRLCCQGNPI